MVSLCQILAYGAKVCFSSLQVFPLTHTVRNNGDHHGTENFHDVNTLKEKNNPKQ